MLRSACLELLWSCARYKVHSKPLLIEQAYDYGRVFKQLGYWPRLAFSSLGTQF